MGTLDLRYYNQETQQWEAPLANGVDLDAVALLLEQHKQADNPHQITKVTVGLGNVDNTSDANKPISTAVQQALSGKADASALAPIYQEIDAVENAFNSHLAQLEYKPITNGTDFNTLTAIGNYVSTSSTVSASLLNCPVASDAFTMTIERVAGSTLGYYRRTIRVNNLRSTTLVQTVVNGLFGKWIDIAEVDALKQRVTLLKTGTQTVVSNTDTHVTWQSIEKSNNDVNFLELQADGKVRILIAGEYDIKFGAGFTAQVSGIRIVRPHHVAFSQTLLAIAASANTSAAYRGAFAAGTILDLIVRHDNSAALDVVGANTRAVIARVG